MKITADGQITIPKEIRDKYGLQPDTEVEIVDADEGVFLRKVENGREPMRAWIERVRGITKGGMTTDEVMRLTRGED